MTLTEFSSSVIFLGWGLAFWNEYMRTDIHTPSTSYGEWGSQRETRREGKTEDEGHIYICVCVHVEWSVVGE